MADSNYKVITKRWQEFVDRKLKLLSISTIALWIITLVIALYVVVYGLE